MAKGAAGVPFSIEFLFSRMAITASSRSKHRYLHSVASWLMMYALLAKGHYVIDPPSHIFRLLYEVPEGWSIFDGWGTWLKKQSKETRPPTLTSQMALYEQINFLSMALFFWSTPDQTRPEDLIDFLRSRLHQFAHYSRARFGETQVHDLPNPSDILISNLHVWALHSGHEEVVRYLKQYQLDTAQHLELWPIVRIIV